LNFVPPPVTTDRLTGEHGALQRSADGAPSTMADERAHGTKGDARVVVLTIISEEFAEAREVFGASHNIPGTNYFASHADGRKWDVIVTRCMDRGNLCSGNEIRSIIDDLRPTYVIVVGIAGGLSDPPRPVRRGKVPRKPKGQQSGRDDIKVGDVLIADHLDYVEFLKVVDKKTVSHRQFSMDQPSFWVRRNFLATMEHTLDLPPMVGEPPEPATPRLRSGQIVSGEKVFSAEGNPVQDILLDPFVKAVGVDMESVGIGRAIHETRHPHWYNPHYVVIRGISDLVGKPGNQKKRDVWRSFAARAASKVALALVTQLLELNDSEDDESFPTEAEPGRNP
jgi:nucleoside phosphorylase